MGCVQSPSEKKGLKSVSKEIAADKQKDKEIKKLLFVGSGGSGKSTIFKQLRTIHGSGFEEKDRLQFKDHIYAQIVEQMRLCLDCIVIVKGEKDDDAVDDSVSEEHKEHFKDVELAELSDVGKEAAETVESAQTLQVTEEMADAIETLWKESTIKTIYGLRAILKIDDSCAYFWDAVKRISATDFVPTDKDILLVRYRTTGVIEQSFEIKKNNFHVFDVGGQKSERKKWIHCFESVTAVLYVAALSCYNEVMFEDESKNSMEDSIELWEEICNNDWFDQTAMILLLNKKDLFAEKLKFVPITKCPPLENFEGNANDFDECSRYIQKVYEDCNKQENKQVFTHFVCATDKNGIDKVFNDIQHVVLEYSLQGRGLI